MTGVEMIKLLKKNKILPFKIAKSSHYHYHINGVFFQIPHHHKELGKGLEDLILKSTKLK